MTYLEEFGDDPGTMWTASGDSLRVIRPGIPARKLAKDLRNRAAKLPIVWFVDDETANREWFADSHRQHFCLVTFSCRAHVRQAIQLGIPCDVVVTDVFFAAETPSNEDAAKRLLDIYGRIESTTIRDLDRLWPTVRKDWRLDGFDIATDVASWARLRKEVIPVVLYSRKAPLLLTDDEWLTDASAVRNTFWMTEKIDPAKKGDISRRVAAIQRNRITAYLALRQRSVPLWRKVLAGVGFGFGPLAYSIEPLLRQD